LPLRAAVDPLLATITTVRPELVEGLAQGSTGSVRTEHSVSQRKQLFPFAMLSASYFAHIGFFNPYLPLWLKDMGFSLIAISVLTSVQSATRLFAPYAWGTLSDRTGERVKLLRYGGTF
jgi:hypothetical protein